MKRLLGNPLVVVWIVLLAACTPPSTLATPSPAATPVTAATAVATNAPVPSAPSAVPTAASTAVRTEPEAAPAPAGSPTTLSFGVPAGDAYTPSSLAVDAAHRLAFVYAMRSPQGSPVISVVDLARAEVQRVIPLSFVQHAAGSGQVLIAPDGSTGYAVDQDKQSLMAFDARTGAPGRQLSKVRDAALSPDGTLLFASSDDGLSAYDSRDLRLAWHADEHVYGPVVASTDRVLATGSGEGNPLFLHEAATGKLIARASLPDYVQGIAAGPAGGWAVRVSSSPQRVLRLDAGLKTVVDVEVPTGSGLFYDAARHRYLLSGRASAQPYRSTVLALAEDTLAKLSEQEWAWETLPDLWATDEDAILALTRYEGVRIDYVDPGTLLPGRRAVLGVMLPGMALDEAAGRLYVADNQDRVHVLALPHGDEQVAWDGRAPIALDAANGRLYVNRPQGVVALDTGNGRVVASYPIGGGPAPDPQRDLVYIISDDGLTAFDRQGKTVARLDSSFPVENGFNPNPYTIAARVNPANGYVVATLNNGVPGSNNGSFLRFYPPATDRGADAPGSFNFVWDVAFEPRQGTVYASYAATFKSLEALQKLSPDGKESGLLRGRQGALAYDAGSGLLYAVANGALARVDAATMSLLDIHQAPDDISQVLLAAKTGQLLYRDAESSRLAVGSLDHLTPLDVGPQPISALPEGEVYGIGATAEGGGTTLYVTAGTGLYRSRDGARWERLLASALPVYGQLAVAGSGVLYYGGKGPSGADGVWRSADGGDTWQLASQGLSDLRARQALLAEDADHVYFLGQTSGLQTWRASQERWETIWKPTASADDPGSFSLAPDGTLFQVFWESMRRSRDRGTSWDEVTTPGEGAVIVGYTADFATSHTLFAVYDGADGDRLVRSRDAAQSWEPADNGLALPTFLGSDLKVLPFGETLYMHYGTASDSRLYRSRDEGQSWERGTAQGIAHTGAFAVAPDGRLWFGIIGGGVRSLDPAGIAWSPAATAVPTAN